MYHPFHSCKVISQNATIRIFLENLENNYYEILQLLIYGAAELVISTILSPLCLRFEQEVMTMTIS